MCRRHFIIIALLTLLSSGCSSTPKAPDTGLHASQASLAEASYAVSRSITELSETAQAAHPLPSLPPAPAPDSYGMGALTSVDWSGPVEPLLQQIGRASNYRVRVLGTAPAIPTLVTIYARNAMLADILRDVGYQCGRRAAVVVYPESRVIELRYAKN